MHKTCRGCPKKLPDVFEELETGAAARDSSHPHSDLPGLHPKRHPIPDIIHYFLPGPITFWSKVLHKILVTDCHLESSPGIIPASCKQLFLLFGKPGVFLLITYRKRAKQDLMRAELDEWSTGQCSRPEKTH